MENQIAGRAESGPCQWEFWGLGSWLVYCGRWYVDTFRMAGGELWSLGLVACIYHVLLMIGLEDTVIEVRFSINFSCSSGYFKFYDWLCGCGTDILLGMHDNYEFVLNLIYQAPKHLFSFTRLDYHTVEDLATFSPI